MLVFALYEGYRLTLEVPTGMTVGALKAMIQEKLNISVDLYKQDKKELVLSYAGADLGDDWVFSDLGVLPGTTIRLLLKDEVKPVLYIRCSHNQELISIFESIKIIHYELQQIRSLASTKSGLPVGIFRLTTVDEKEMFDTHTLGDYGVDIGHTILLETWDGWNEFLNLAIMGFTPQVVSQLCGEEVVQRYQMKVALFIAAHFGHVDLARSMLRQGCKSDELVGYHPARTWCKDDGHVDALKCPVHEATLCGQLGVLRLFVNQDVCCLKAKDANGLEPLNIALRCKIKHCASFILTKQWSKIAISKHLSLHLPTYTRLRKWCDRAKDRALLKYGHAKSSLKRRNFNTGPLLSHGILLDGFSKSSMNGKSKAQMQKDDRTKERRNQKNAQSLQDISMTEDPENYFKSLTAWQGHRQSQYGRQLGRRASHKFSKGSVGGLRLKAEEANKLASIQARDSETSTSKKGFVPKISGYQSPETKAKGPSTFTESSEMSEDIPLKLPALSQDNRTRQFSQNQKSSDKENQDTTKSKQNIDKNQTDKTPASRLIKNKSAYFMTSAPSVKTFSNYPESEMMSINIDKSKTERKASLGSDGDKKVQNVTSMSTDVEENNEDDLKKPVNPKKKRKPRVTSALLLSKASGSDGSIPLPLISQEQDRRPFFYHQGMREDDLVEPALGLVDRYKGDTPRERAIKSLSLANCFIEKPWLGQVQVALNLTTNSLKRSLHGKRKEKKTISKNTEISSRVY